MSIPQKLKPCKGNYRTNHFPGCKELTYAYKYGLCKPCFMEWVYSTGEGSEYLKKSIIPQAKKDVKTKARKEKTEAKKRLLSNDAYRAKIVQPIINEIARLIDYGQPCIATGTYGKMNGGHYIAVGANRTTALNLHNIHIQSYHSNGPKGGDNLKYRLGLIETYGQAYADAVQALHQTPTLKLSKERLKEVEKIASEIRNGLKKNPVILEPEDRIEMRQIINAQIGIYEPLIIKQ